MKKALIPMIAAAALAVIAACSGKEDEGPDYSDIPAAPSGFDLNGISASCVEFRWDDNSDNETSFVLQRAADAGFADIIYEQKLPADRVRYRDYDPFPGAVRYFRVLAANEEGRSAPTAAVPAAMPSALTPSPGKIADHTVVGQIRQGRVPVTAIQKAKSDLRIAFGHTSHGSQIVDGMDGLVAFADAGCCDGVNGYSAAPGLFSWSHGGANGALMMTEDMGNYDSTYDAYDLNNPSYTAWYQATVDYLGVHPEINVVMWSWCGGVSGASSDTIANDYLARMALLERDFPSVAFVYMTGHGDGTGTGGNLHQRNEQIRAYCRDNGKWLFDFNDIESYDPEGILYADRYADDACNYDFNRSGGLDFDNLGNLSSGDRNWAVDWQDEHPVFPGSDAASWYECGSAHSQPLVANMKAYAAWWLWCRIAGWSGS
jgi:hypothetical protein